MTTGEFPWLTPHNADYLRLFALVQQVRSDPFLPQKIRDKVTPFLEQRAQAIYEVHSEHLGKYQESLAKGTNDLDLKKNEDVIHNRVMNGLIERGYGCERIEQEIHKLRLEIQDFLERSSLPFERSREPLVTG